MQQEQQPAAESTPGKPARRRAARGAGDTATPAPKRGEKKGRQRGNGEGSIYLQERRLKNGKVAKRWVGSLFRDGKWQYIYGSSRAEVAQKLTEALKERQDGIPWASGRRTLGAWLDHWLANVVKPEREPTTYEQYEIAVRVHTKPYLGDIPITKLVPEDVVEWLRKLEAKKVGVRTRQVALTRLRTALALAVKRRRSTGVTYNAAALVERPKQPKVKRVSPKPEVLERLLGVIHGERLEAMVILALAAGLRRGEALGLQWEDIDRDARTLTVRRRVSRVGKKARKDDESGLLVREGAKSDSGQRVVMLSEIAMDALQARWKRQLEERMAAGAEWKGPDYHGGKATGFVFTSEVGTELKPRYVDKSFHSVRYRAGLGDKTFYGLRHDFASLLLKSRVQGRIVQEMMGHSDYSITANVYQTPADAQQREAADLLNGILRAAQARGIARATQTRKAS
jgi:integrase